MSIQTIHAIQVHAYGDADQLKFEETTRPQPKEGEVLVRVHAAGVNPIDWKIRTGMLKDFMPKTLPYVPGADLAGIVEEVGPGVTAFQVGQEVFGQSSQGTYTEYALSPTTRLALKPETMSFDEAVTILWVLQPRGKDSLITVTYNLVNECTILGGAGGVGLFAVQFARWKGAHVISTASTHNVDYVRSLGADTVIDYTKTKVEDEVHDVDLVLDTVGGSALASVLPTLKRGGTLITIAGQPDEAKAKEVDVRTGRFSAQVSSELLSKFAQLIDEGHIKVFVGETFPLNKAAQAHELSQRGHGRGRIVLQVS